MGFRGTPWSRTQYYRRKRRAEELACSIYDVPDRRGKHGNHVSGSNHVRWSNKKIISSHGYTKVRVGCGHPLADPNGYAYEHLLVWIAAGREAPGEDLLLHHINGDRQDNRIENLALIPKIEHSRLHAPKRDPVTGRFVSASI